jgi:UDP-N-acetylmuramoyl-tripeptide--D-alanyl-D-alanine ligase
MAAAYRRELDIPIVAITGSNGKTTTRQFMTKILSAEFSVGATEGNWNNHIGVPLCLLKLTGKEDIAIYELGANHHGEIHTLTRIVRPDIGIITNIGFAHIGYFGSREAIAEAKLEIIDGIPKKDGLLLLNGDDSLLVRICEKNGYPAVFFGTSSRCAIRAENICIDNKGRSSFSVKGKRYTLSMPGRHFIYGALPAIFLARQLGVPEETIAQGILSLQPDPMRGRIEIKSGITFILDCYNANPSSMKAGIALLQDIAGKKSSGAIIGDMLELGTHATRLHKQLGRDLAAAGIRKLVVVGDYASVVADGAVQRGMRVRNIFSASDPEKVVVGARTLFKAGDTVLIKGSRGMKLETIYQQL